MVPLSLGNVPLSLHRPLVSTDRASVSRQGKDMIRGSGAVLTAGSDVSLWCSAVFTGASVFFAGS